MQVNFEAGFATAEVVLSVLLSNGGLNVYVAVLASRPNSGALDILILTIPSVPLSSQHMHTVKLSGR
jgi:hypothetical protein